MPELKSANVGETHLARQRLEMLEAKPLVQVSTHTPVEFKPKRDGLDGQVATQLSVDGSANLPPEQVVVHFQTRLSLYVPDGHDDKQIWLVSSPNEPLEQLLTQIRVVFKP